MKESLGASKRPTVLYVEFDLFNRRSQGVSDSIWWRPKFNKGWNEGKTDYFISQ